MSDQITIRTADVDDARLLTDLSYTTFWDAFAHHPKNAPEDMTHYMRQAFSEEQIAAELAAEENIFLIADVDGKPAGYAKLIVGSIEPGKQADLAAIRLGEIETQPLYDAISQIVYAAGRHQVSDVWIAGVRKLRERALADLDVVEVLEKARRWGERLAN